MLLICVYQVLQNLNRGQAKLPLLGPFDKGLNGITLFHFAEHASTDGLAAYVKLRAAASSSKIRLGLPFWAGVQSFEKKSKLQPEGVSEGGGDSEIERVTTAEFNRTVRFIESGGALRILRVLSKLCDEPTYIKISNWLCFDAKSFDCIQLCYLVLSMLTAQPKFAAIIDQNRLDNTGTAGSTENAQHAHKLVSAALHLPHDNETNAAYGQLWPI